METFCEVNEKWTKKLGKSQAEHFFDGKYTQYLVTL